MKLIIMFLLYSFSANATTYYVSNAGSDAAAGTSTGTSWQTIAKINSFSLSPGFSPGDQILLNKGDSWNERLVFLSSGTALNPIVISSYGSGNKPVITGLQTQGGFTNVGNIWTATATNSVAYLNTVLIGGVIRAKGRYPNTGYLTYTGHSGATQITGSLTGTPDYTGAEAVVRVFHWVIDVVKITSQSGGTLNLSPALTYTPFNNYGYFIQNSPSVLDTANEWSFDSTTKVLKVYSSGSPSVQISTIDTLVWVQSRDYITFDGLSLTGANKAAFEIDTSRHITIQNCSINYSGTLGISGKKSAYCTVQNDSIQNSLSGAIYLRRVDPFTTMQDTCNSVLVDNNYIKNTGVFAGMGMSNNGRYNAINVVGTSETVTNNRIDSTGYIGIIWMGTNGLIKHNYITNFCITKSEGGGIYTFTDGTIISSTYCNGSKITSNIVIGSAPYGIQGIPDNAITCSGIFIDGTCRVNRIDSNTVVGGLASNLTFNGTYCDSVLDNTSVDSLGAGFVGSELGVGIIKMKRNIFYSQSRLQRALSFGFGISVFAPFIQAGGVCDSNYYLRPVQEDSIMQVTSAYYNLSTWTTRYGFDANSHTTPSGITAALPLFYINPTLVDSTFSLSGLYYDAKGIPHNNSITIAPFQSALLFKSTSEVPVATTGKKIGHLIFE